MPVVKPFNAVRPEEKYVKDIASLPYDVISEQEARDDFKKRPLSFFRIGRPEVNLPEGVDPYSEPVYLKAKEVIDEYLEKKIFFKEKESCFYVYSQEMQGYQQIGIVALVSVDDYNKDIIKKHELTREDKEKDRVNHIIKSQAHNEPVFLTYPDNPFINFMVNTYIQTNKPVYDFATADGVKNTLWKIDDMQIKFSIETFFNYDVRELYIADGHHRAKASTLAAKHFREKNPNHTGEESYNYFMAVIFPSSHLRILPYHRVVKNKMPIAELIEKCKGTYKVTETTAEEAKKGSFIVYNKKKSYLFEFVGQMPKNPDEKLDVALLQKFVLDPILGIKDPRKDKNIDFVGGIRGIEYLKKQVDSGDFDLAFIMPATVIQDLFDVSDSGKIMPPKSTWFEPKLKSGLFLNLID